MREPRDECRPVTLPSGETVRVRGRRPMTPDEADALGEIVDAVRAKMAAEYPSDPRAEELWARFDAARGDRMLHDVAREVAVGPGVLFRLMQGRYPGPAEVAAIEAWLDREAVP